MNREYAEDTLKSNLIIPVSYRKLIFAKIAVTVFAVTLFVAVSFLCSIVFAVILRYHFNLEDVGMAWNCGENRKGYCGKDEEGIWI